MATGLVIAQLRAQMALPDHANRCALGIVYFTDHYADDALALLGMLRQELPDVSDWVGTVGVGIAANNVEYFDEPALAVMLCALPQQDYRVFSGVAPLAARADFRPHSALVHADGNTPDLAELLSELAGRTDSGYLFGGLAASRRSVPQIAHHAGSMQAGVFAGALSGVAFSERISMVSRVTQGCQPIRLPNGQAAKPHVITQSDRHVVLSLDGTSALDVLLDELGISMRDPQRAAQSFRQTFVGLTAVSNNGLVAGQGLNGEFERGLGQSVEGSQGQSIARSQGRFGAQTRVRHLVGLDPLRRGIAVSDMTPVGSELTFCERHREAARRDLMRICAEIREELSPAESDINLTEHAENAADAMNSIAHHADSTLATRHFSTRKIVGAIYVSCAGRGGAHFGGDSAEMHIVRHALGDVPLVGFFAGGEIAHQNLYGYTGVLTVFTAEV